MFEPNITMSELADAINSYVTKMAGLPAEFMIPDSGYMDALIHETGIATVVDNDNRMPTEILGIQVRVSPWLPPDIGMFVDTDGRPVATFRVKRDNAKEME